MMRKSKKKKSEEHVDEAWLLPYADLLTLLLAVFIVLFSMSTVDATKFDKLSKAFNDIFTGGTGALDYPSPMPEGNAEATDENEEPDKRDIAGTTVTNTPSEEEKLQAIQTKMDAFIQEKGLQEELETSLTDEGLMITIGDNILFESGKAEISPENIKVARDLSELLVLDETRNIIISGHTDNVPIRNAQFASNWELSVMRAVNFMKLLLQNDKLDPRWFSAKGYGEFQPISDNRTAEGRAKNRRVEILILPNHPPDETAKNRTN
ncbi:MAG TPA: flagellar motor protein MotB [Bacillus sp. (in: firmicutes)]|nr:flagellar motor protein MotB [Bacillus litorisediminis]HWO74593.1 flagellar motor protein MotB [Bacillus sp. (in: firmicutes)]